MKFKFFLKKSFYSFLGNNKKLDINEKNLIIKSENKNWVLNQLANEYKKAFSNIFNNISLDEKDIYISDNFHLFIMSKYYALENLHNFNNKIYFPYFHGISDLAQLKKNVVFIKKNLNKISKIQVSNSLIENFFLEYGIPQEKFMRIPITVDINKFDSIQNYTKNEIRELYNIPKSAFVVGSFQKDGDGWGRGNNPKLIKGPDIFIKTIEILKKNIPEIFVLISGPSRGYVVSNLNKLKIPFKYLNFSNYDDLINLYKCLDVYLVCSREEGGPRAIMESFASKIPLVTTNVGQAIDMIKNNHNAFKSDEINEEILANLIFSKVYKKDDKLEEIIKNAYITAKNNSYESQINLWENFFDFKKERIK